MAFKALFERYYTPLYRFTTRFIRDAQNADNLVQDLFVKLWTQRENLHINSNLKSYLYISLKNSALNYIKSQNSTVADKAELLLQPEKTQNPEEGYINSEMHQAVHDAIDKLPVKCRQIYLMKNYDNLKYIEIAEIMGISVNTVKTQLKRALQSLHKSLAHLFTLLFR